MESLTRLMDEVLGRTRRISSRGRWLGSLCLLAVACGLIGFAASRPGATRVPLLDGQRFSNPQLERMAQALRAAHLEGAVVQDGQLLVPENEREAYRAALASARELAPDPDELLAQAVTDTNPLLSPSQAEMRRRYGEWKKLEVIVAGMTGIESASVQCAETKRAGFPPRIERHAFVAIRGLAGRHLERTQVEAIRYMVGGFLGLQREEVTISDLNACRTFPGSCVDDPGANRADLLPSARHELEDEYRKKLEDEYRKKIVQHLVRYPGAIVSVNVEFAEPRLVENPDASPIARLPVVTAAVDLPRSCLDLGMADPAGGQAVAEDGAQSAQAARRVLDSVEATVTALLPPLPPACGGRRQVTVTASADIPHVAAADPSLLASRPAAALLALGGLLLVLCGLGWLRKVRRAGYRPPLGGEAGSDEGSSSGSQAGPPDPDSRREVATAQDYLEQLAAAPAKGTHQRLIEAVRQDPDAAAELLKQWLERAA